jgi:glycosyltransferase involved in cell wall biosynthesis
LMQCLEPQLAPGDGVEVLTQIDNGEESTGVKRNQLLRNASGDYVAFIDDDDLVADDYVYKILSAIESAPDVVGLTMIMTTDGACPEYGFISVSFKSWFQIPDPFSPGRSAYFSCPNHITPVRRDIALRVKFPATRSREDLGYSLRLREHLTSEVFLQSPAYYYLRRTPKRLAGHDPWAEADNLEELHSELRWQTMDGIRSRMLLGINSPDNTEANNQKLSYSGMPYRERKKDA